MLKMNLINLDRT